MADDGDYPGRWVLEALGYKPDGKRNVEAYFQEFLASEPQSGLQALEALHLIGSDLVADEGDSTKDLGGFPHDKLVEVPWWIVAAIAERWVGFKSGDAKTLGKAFGVEASTIKPNGDARGAHKETSKRRTEFKHFRLALEVAAEIEKRVYEKKKRDVNTAIANVADRWNMGFETIRDIWKVDGKLARKAVSGKGEELSNYPR